MCNQYFQRREKTQDTVKRKKENAETEWVLCSQDWRDIVITYVPHLNNIPTEENYADISWEEIKKADK